MSKIHCGGCCLSRKVQPLHGSGTELQRQSRHRSGKRLPRAFTFGRPCAVVPLRMLTGGAVATGVLLVSASETGGAAWSARWAYNDVNCAMPKQWICSNLLGLGRCATVCHGPHPSPRAPIGRLGQGLHPSESWARGCGIAPAVAGSVPYGGHFSSASALLFFFRSMRKVASWVDLGYKSDLHFPIDPTSRWF